MGFAASSLSAAMTSGASAANVTPRGLAVGKLERRVTRPAKSDMGFLADCSISGRWFTLCARIISMLSATMESEPACASDGVAGDPARIFLRSGQSSSLSYLSLSPAAVTSAPNFLGSGANTPGAVGLTPRPARVSLTNV